MERFAELLDRLYYTAGTNAKSRLLQQYLAETPDPDRGWAVAAIGGTLSFDLFKRNLIRTLTQERVDPYLFELSYDYVGEMSETVAHLWPSAAGANEPLPGLAEVVEHFRESNAAEARTYLAQLLDVMTPSQRWALVKLGTRGLRIGMSARSLKRALADYGNVEVEQIERLWHGLEPPYESLLQWLDGTGPEPDVSRSLTFHPVMLSHPAEEKDIAALDADQWQAEWKYDGIRVQLVSTAAGVALFSRTGDDISGAFPDVVEAVNFRAIIDGELLVRRGERIGSFNELQQRLGRKKPPRKLIEANPAGIIAYDALALDGESVTSLKLVERRARLDAFLKQHAPPQISMSQTLRFVSRNDLEALRAQADRQNATYVEGLMLKRRAGQYVPGRPKGEWYKWKRDPMLVDAVMMYAQRGHGKRSSFYSDYTFGLWEDDTLLPIGKAYSGFTDEELKKLDRWVRNNTVGRFGPVREVDKALVLEVAFDDVHASKRHKSGLALRFPRIHRIRWDKPAAEADRLATLKRHIHDASSERV